MANFLRGQSALYKLTAISVAGLLLGIGLCGTGAALPNPQVDEFFFWAGSSVFWLSTLGLVVCIVWGVIKGLIEGGSPRR